MCARAFGVALVVLPIFVGIFIFFSLQSIGGRAAVNKRKLCGS